MDDNIYDDLTTKDFFAWKCPQCEVLVFNNSFFNTSNQTNPTDTDDENKNKNDTYAPRHQNKKKKLRSLLINFQSIKNKVADIESLIELYDPDIIQGTETWLTPNIQSSEVIPNNYTTHRKDRTSDNHGGVLFAHKKDLIVTQRRELDSGCEIIWNQIEIKGRRSLLFGTYYKPKHDDNKSLEGLQESLDKINTTNKTTDVIVCGDANQPNIDWNKGRVDRNHWASKDVAESLLQIIDENGLQQEVTEPTRGENILDIVLTNNDRLIKTTVIPGISDHNIVMIDI